MKDFPDPMNNPLRCVCGNFPLLKIGTFRGMRGIMPRRVFFMLCKDHTGEPRRGPQAFSAEEAQERWDTMHAAHTLTL